MRIRINNSEIETKDGQTLIEAAREGGFAIPSLCFAPGAQHKSSCMVCAVKNSQTGQIIPSCTTLATEGMQIETDSEEVLLIRRLSLELLLSDHRADCQAPCTLVCPQGLDIEQVLSFYDSGDLQMARKLIAMAFSLPVLACENCKAPCEKVCRRGMVDKSVSIRAIIAQIAKLDTNDAADCVLNSESAGATFASLRDKDEYQSLVGRFSEKEKEALKERTTTSSGCLHCACDGRVKCKLRRYATEAGIKRSRYNIGSDLAIMQRQSLGAGMWFEPAKCIRCGLCVYNSKDGFTFKGRGFPMEVILPEQSVSHIGSELSDLCPTGAIYCKL